MSKERQLKTTWNVKHTRRRGEPGRCWKDDFEVGTGIKLHS